MTASAMPPDRHATVARVAWVVIGGAPGPAAKAGAIVLLGHIEAETRTS